MTTAKARTTAECLGDFEAISERWVKTGRLTQKARRCCLAVLKGEDLVPASDLAPAPVAADDELLTRQQVADILGVSVHSVKKWNLDGHLPYETAGRQVRIRRADLDAYRATRTHTAAPATAREATP